MSKTCRKTRCYKVNGSTDAKETTSIYRSLGLVFFCAFLASCASLSKQNLGGSTTSRVCTLGEASVLLLLDGNESRYNVSFRKGEKRWFFGVDIPLRGEEVFWTDSLGQVSSNFKEFLGPNRTMLRRVLLNIFPINTNIRNTSNISLPDGFSLIQAHDLDSEGNFKVFLMKKFFFIKRTYARLEFRLTSCSKREKFKIIKN